MASGLVGHLACAVVCTGRPVALWIASGYLWDKQRDTAVSKNTWRPDKELWYLVVHGVMSALNWHRKVAYAVQRYAGAHIYSYLPRITRINSRSRAVVYHTPLHACAATRYQYSNETTKHSVAFSPQTNYTDWATPTCWRNLVPT
jgi:hypothetical protein